MQLIAAREHENQLNPAAFPGGLKPILEAVEAGGACGWGLWVPMAAIGKDTADYKRILRLLEQATLLAKQWSQADLSM